MFSSVRRSEGEETVSFFVCVRAAVFSLADTRACTTRRVRGPPSRRCQVGDFTRRRRRAAFLRSRVRCRRTSSVGVAKKKIRTHLIQIGVRTMTTNDERQRRDASQVKRVRISTLDANEVHRCNISFSTVI